ncbi:MAG: EFR1 family ferrodoxin [Spirochaetes bacterium]|nr:EFR1 family ferrodoxin [Spirochaetota bacterium]
MKITLFYFSGTGNTWFAANQFKNRCESLNYEVHLYSIENPLLTEEKVLSLINESHLIGVGYPIYGSDVPKNMLNFIKSLPIQEKPQDFFSFCTQAMFSGDGNWFIKKILKNRGYTLKYSFQINMSSNFYVPLFSPFKPYTGKKLNITNEKAKKRIEQAVTKINQQKPFIQGTDPISILIGWLQRVFFRKFEFMLTNLFFVNETSCTDCGLCIKMCPVNNIERKVQKITFLNKCILCFRCYNLCPVNAINCGKRTINSEKYIRFKGPVEKMKVNDIRQ